MDTLNLSNPEFYINRELSLLEFNRRVIAQAEDESMPLLERLKFLCIASTNLDEFFEIRVAGVKQQVKYGSVQTGPDNLSPVETLKQVGVVAHELVDTQYSVLNDVIMPENWKKRGYIFCGAVNGGLPVSRWVKRYFNTNVLPVLSPIGLDPRAPVSPGAEQEPLFHRHPRRQGRIRTGNPPVHRPGAPVAAQGGAPAGRHQQGKMELRVAVVHHPIRTWTTCSPA